jgi:pyruvate dehydrogenase E2 component (dihydrolipoamide acetyltransferase)
MKKCPSCNRTYAEDLFSFCLEDGSLLSAPYDPNATLVINPQNAELPPTEVLNISEGELTKIYMPQMGESISEGTLTRWLKNVGEKVESDEALFEISTDKVDAEIPSPSSGVLVRILVHEGKTIPVNTVVAYISASYNPNAILVIDPRNDELPPTEILDSTEGEALDFWEEEELEKIVTPEMGESITELTLTNWLIKVGQEIKKDDPIYEISTDKADVELPSPISGILVKILVHEGETVPYNTPVALFKRIY